MRIVDLSIKRPTVVSVVILTFLVVGFLSYLGLTINDMPEADIPIISVTATDRGVAPDQMETKVAKKLEDAIGQVSGVKHISTNITEGSCIIAVEFVLEKSPDVAAQEIRDKISAIRKELPDEMDEPIVAKYDFSAEPILSLAVTGEMDNRALAKLVDDVIAKRFQAVSGVGAVQIYGEEEREIQIKADSEKLAAYGLNPAEMVAAVLDGNVETPGGQVEKDGRQVALRTDNLVRSLDDFYSIPIGSRGGHDITVRDVATVYDGTAELESLSFYDGQPAISIDIVKQSGANTVEVADRLKAELDLMRQLMPDTLQIQVIRDNSESIRDSVHEVVKTIIEGCILAVIIVFIFLGEWETTLISAISLPVSIITTFIAMKVMHFTLNTMSLMALSLAVGLLVDDAIVVIENIVRHLHMGKPPLQAALDGTSEIGLAVTATTMAVVAVFIPIGMVSGMIGRFFIEFGLTVAFSMLISLFVSFTLVPVMGSRMLRSGDAPRQGVIHRALGVFNRGFDSLTTHYGKLLVRALERRWLVLAALMGLFAGSIAMIPALGFAFIPSTDNGQINITAALDSGLTLEARGEMAHTLEALLSKHPETAHVYTTVGADSATLFVELTEKKERTLDSKEIADQFRKDLQKLPGVTATVSPGSLGPASGKDVALIIQGEDLEKIRQVALALRKEMEADPHSKDVSMSEKTGKLEAKLVVDRERAEDLGVDVSMAADTLKALYDGIDAGKFEYGGDRYNIRMSLEASQRQSLDSLDGIFVNSSEGHPIALESIVRKQLSTAAASINRYDRMKQIEVSANVYGMASGDYLKTHLKKAGELAAATPGVFVGLSGMDETMQEGFSSLVTALGMGILFMYMIMVMQFGSYLEPVAIMFALPMALIGAVGGLYAAGSQMSIMALIGLILLMGLVAKNGILLVDFCKQRQAEGLSVRDALVAAGKVRLRPILMTSAAMIFGMIPVAVATGSGTEMRAPMGHSVIGGLISSTILTLFVVPVVYSLLTDLKTWAGGLRQRHPKAPEGVRAE